MDAVVRRVIPSDNSCLFNAVGYVMEHNKNKASELRQVIAATVMSDAATYNELVLEKPNEVYSQWIQDPEKWGGAIELAILAKYYKREIAAYDIQTIRCDVYGQGEGYTERVMLIYDGLHYDALAMTFFEGAPEEVDQTIFPILADGTIGNVSKLAEKLVHEAQRQRKFTDTSNFTIRCAVCQKAFVGQKFWTFMWLVGVRLGKKIQLRAFQYGQLEQEAVEHATQTGHTNFQEVK